MWIELNLIAAVAGGFGLLMWRNRKRHARRQRQADARGLVHRERDLSDLTPELIHSVLFQVADGGHERDIISGDVELGPHEVHFTQFDFEFQRDVRGEWAYLETTPPFRLMSPTTVLAYRVPVELPHLLLKRRGRAETVRDQDLEVAKSIASFTRDITAIDRAVGVRPPDSIGRDPIDVPGLEDYLAFSTDERARDLIDDDLVAFLQSLESGGGELVLELVGHLMLLYCASDGELSHDDAVALARFADQLCLRLLERTCQ